MQDTRLLNPKIVAEKGQEIYDAKLKQELEAKEIGRFVAIDVVSGNYFLGDSILEAVELARDRYPGRLVHTVRVGYPGVFEMGSRVGGFSYAW